MSQNFDSLKQQFEAQAINPPQRKTPKKSWIPTPFTQISLTTTESNEPSQSMVNSRTENPKPPNPPIDSILNIGDQIETTNGRLGNVRYIGNIDVKKGIWIGVELNEPTGNHNGTLKGKQYFKTAPNHATFIKHKKIKRVIKPDQQNNNTDTNRPNALQIDDETQSSAIEILQSDNINNIPKSVQMSNEKKKKKVKRSYFDSNAMQHKSDSDYSDQIEINMNNTNTYSTSHNSNSERNIALTPQSNHSDINSPPPIPDQYNMSTNTSYTTDDTLEEVNDINLDTNTKDFDIQSFQNIKEKLRIALRKQSGDTLDFSKMFDDKLKDKKRYNKSLKRLEEYIDGLIEYTHNMLNNMEINNSDIAAQFESPFNRLPDKILNIDMYKYGHLCFDLTLKYIEILSFLEEIVWIPLQYVAMILPSAIGIRLLFDMPNKIHIFPPIYINRVCKCVVEGSQFPIAICLKIAEFTKIISQRATAYANEYDKLSEFYTNIAIDILRDIHSDHAALICLECPTDFEPITEPPLDSLKIAIRSENGKFIANKRVMCILNGMWESSSFIEGNNIPHAHDHFTTYDKNNFLILFRDHYRSVPAIPCGKYAMQLLLFIFEVVLLSWFAVRRLTLESSFEFYEIFLWAFGLSSAAESIYMTVNNDRLFRMNMADLSSLLLGFNFGILAGIRFYYLLNTKQNSVHSMDIIFETIYAFTVILAFLRVSTLLSMNKKLGSLLIVVKQMVTDIQNFALLWVLFVFGFVFAEYYYIAQYIDDSFSDTLLAIFGVSTTGDAKFSKYSKSDTVSMARSTVSQIMLALLVLFGALLLINFFIAMMTKTFDAFSDKSNTQWSLNTAHFIVQYDRRNDILPPPFNLIVYILILLWYTFEIPIVLMFNINPIGTINLSSNQLSFKQKLYSIIYGQNNVWLCAYCHSVQVVKSKENNIKDLKKWMTRIGFDTRDREAIFQTESVLCDYCKRVKRNQYRCEWIADNISYYIAYIFILPIILILTVPTGSFGILWETLVDVEKNDVQEFYQLLHEKQKQRIENKDPFNMKKLFTQKRISEMLDSMKQD